MKDDNPLTGRFFHTTNKEGEIVYQGYVIGWLGNTDYYLVRLLDWLEGNPSSERIVAIHEMLFWVFYPDAALMCHFYKDYPVNADGKKYIPGAPHT